MTNKKQRDLALERDGRCCASCGSCRNLEVHHIVPRGDGGGDDLGNLKTLCRRCHMRAHAELRCERAEAELLRKGGAAGPAMLVELLGDRPLALLSALQGVEALCLRHCKDIDMLLPILREIDAIRGGFAHE